MTNGNGAGVDLTGPLAGMWRDVYRKAGQVAEARTQELLKYHVYTYPHGAGDGGGEGEDTGPFVDEAGDTMSGTLHFYGAEADAGGAVRVVPVINAAGSLRGYGAASPPFTPTSQSRGAYEFGLRLRAEVAGTIVAVRWFRVDAAQPPPQVVRLWDATAPDDPVRQTTALAAFLDTAPGWKEQALAAGDELPVVAGRTYAVSYVGLPGGTTVQDPYTPVPDAGLTYMGHGQGFANAYPGGNPTEASGIDVALGTPFGPGATAHSGAIRLPNGDAGVIAWRDAADTADHTLTVDATGTLVYDGVPLGAGGGGTGNTTMYTQTATPAGAVNSLWFNPTESA